MNILKTIYLTILQLARQVRLLPHTIALALKQRRQQAVPTENEVERLDRLRNPSKYQGR